MYVVFQSMRFHAKSPLVYVKTTSPAANQSVRFAIANEFTYNIVNLANIWSTFSLKHEALFFNFLTCVPPALLHRAIPKISRQFFHFTSSYINLNFFQSLKSSYFTSPYRKIISQIHNQPNNLFLLILHFFYFSSRRASVLTWLFFFQLVNVILKGQLTWCVIKRQDDVHVKSEYVLIVMITSK